MTASAAATCAAVVATPASGQLDQQATPCVLDPETGECMADRDRDGRGDTSDNCPDHYNPGQEDNDRDGVGNACDPTPNGDPPPPDGGGGGGGGSTSCASSAPVVLYEHVGSAGRCWGFWPGSHPTIGDANNVASSVRVASGYVATLFTRTYFEASYGWYNAESTSNAANWAGVGNDAASSLVVQVNSPNAGLYDGVDVTDDPGQAAEVLPGSGCSRISDVVKHRHGASGRIHWRYALLVSFCWGGGKVTKLWATEVQPTIEPLPFPFNLIQWWEYSLVTYQQSQAGFSSAIVRADGEFRFCGFRYLCIKHVQPWVRIELFGDGNARCWTSGRPAAHRCLRWAA
jgi:hypothetical protein